MKKFIVILAVVLCMVMAFAVTGCAKPEETVTEETTQETPVTETPVEEGETETPAEETPTDEALAEGAEETPAA